VGAEYGSIRPDLVRRRSFTWPQDETERVDQRSSAGENRYGMGQAEPIISHIIRDRGSKRS
jgi:hypothetical protein